MAKSSNKKSVKSSAKRAVTKALTGKARASRTAAPTTGTISLLVKANPYRAGSNKFKAFALLRHGMPVAKFIAAGGKPGDLARMLKYERISVK